MKKIITLLLSASSLFAYDYSYFLQDVGSNYIGELTAANGEKISYVAPINAIQFGSDASSTSAVSVLFSSSKIKAWATGYQNYFVGTIENQVDSNWKTPENLLGAVSEIDPTKKVCSLGNGGSITLTFSSGIGNGSGADFAVFENGFDANYLELGFVEVSSNGVDFVRFPNFYIGTERIYEWLQHGNTDVAPENVYNLVSKYESGYGHCFDLEELKTVKAYIDSGKSTFSDDYEKAFLASYSTLDFDNVSYIRIIDIYGDGNTKDSIGHSIFDPTGDQRSSPGLDLKGVAVLNTAIIPEPNYIALAFALISLTFCILKKRK